MAAPENSKVSVCYIWLISLILFIFTVSGAIFLVLYIIQPSSTTAYWYPIIGVSLVCFPWFFWSLTILYRVISRSCGFRMICFGSYGSDDSVHDDDLGVSGGGFVEMERGERDVNPVSEAGQVDPGSPKRVHFGGVVIIGEGEEEEEDEGGAHGNEEGNSKQSSSSSSSSDSSSPRKSNESEMPLRLFMAS